MALLNTLSEKIEDLKNNSRDELDIIKEKLDVINNALTSLSSEEKIIESDFSSAIKLVSSQSFGILDFKMIIQDIKYALVAKYKYNQTFISLSKDQVNALKSFQERLEYLKEELEKRKRMGEEVQVSEKVLDSLEDLRDLLINKGRRKYYTYDMIEAFFEVFDYDILSLSEIEEFMDILKVAKNFKGKLQEEKADFNEVTSLFKEFLGKRYNEEYLLDYQDEICSRINLENTRNIFEFFKQENLLSKFSLVSILQITIYGNYEFILKLYQERVIVKPKEIQELYFEDAMSGVWINEKSANIHHNPKIKINGQSEKKKTLHGTISDVTDNEVWENVRLLRENSDLLDTKFNLDNPNSLWIITKPKWLIKKNLDLFRIFNFHNVKITALIQNDLEDKIHFVTEMGLLNTPRTPLFREIEKHIPKYDQFMLNGKKGKIVNPSILDYYKRNTTRIGNTSYTEYIYWFYKMLNSGKEEFFQSFFSTLRSGEHSNDDDFYTRKDIENLKNNEKIEEIIDDNFITNYLDVLISGYDEYNEIIKEYNFSSKGEELNPYFDENILNDEPALRLNEFSVIDEIVSSGVAKTYLNEYVYMFGDTLISRYKVLRNLSILKGIYGYLNDDMLLTAIFRNAYVSKEQFDNIKEKIMKGSKTI